MEPALAPTSTAGDQVLPPSADEVKYSCPGCTANVFGSSLWPQIRASTTPLGRTTMEAS